MKEVTGIVIERARNCGTVIGEPRTTLERTQIRLISDIKMIQNRMISDIVSEQIDI